MVPHCRRAPRRSNRHEYLRRALLQDQDKPCCPVPVFAATAWVSTRPGRRCFQVRLDQFIVLPCACVRRNGMSEWSST
ncbi:hypothetical protein MTO96_031268 [Rhipicephalus appendiculatus]